ncbi:MAG: hypothetical protein IIA58_01515 [Candidatus Marinimicrobia bacterium]|nr:hypothetical protein [Candidatus Neomarinimicrobiota bacterium]
MTDEKAAAVITAQPEEVSIGENSYTVKPRTLTQMRAISKSIAKYRDGVYIAVESLKSKNDDEIESTVDKLLDMPFDHIIRIVQMFLDENEVFEAANSTVKTDELEKTGFDNLKEVVGKLLNMHNLEDILKKISGLRVL